MHIFSWTTLFLAASVRAVDTAANKSSGILQADLVFPQNATYAPTSVLPIVFAFRNAEFANFLQPQVSFTVWKWNNTSKIFGTDKSYASKNYDMEWANFSSHEPYFEYQTFSDFNTEGTWLVVWSLGWVSCTERSLGKQFSSNVTTKGLVFTTKDSAQEVDLASTNEICSEDAGVAVNITETLKVTTTQDDYWDLDRGDTCAVVASSTPKPDPCLPQIDSAAAASMKASLTKQLCQVINPPASCPSKPESAAQRLLVASVACLAAALGASLFTLL